VDDVGTRIAAVRERIDRAARESGRAPDSIRLVAVSKTKPVEDIRAAYAAGQRDFGENYVQELVGKAEALSDLADLRFHFIGHLQRNKAKLAAEHASVVHTVDSAKLAGELGRRAAAFPVSPAAAFLEPSNDSRLVVLVEVNVGGEAQKSGCRPEELGAVLGAVEAEPALRLAGLMTVPPFTDSASGSRPFFDALARLRDAHGGTGRLPELSMGMTHDLKHAIAAGATIVRVGTAIFGERARK
jgi:pyridoxal phosphate enzyme (YggS family)